VGLEPGAADLLGGGIVNALRMIWVFARVGAMGELAYRANFFLQLFESLLSLCTMLGVISIVMGQTGELRGWTPAELLVVVGVFFIILGLINLVISPSLSRFMEEVRDGTFDYTLLKPADVQLLVSVSQVHVFKLIDVAMGVGVLVYATLRLGGTLGWPDALSFVVALGCGGAIVYSFWIALAAMAFWFIRLENVLMIFWMVYNAGRWPLAVYPGWLRFGLTVVVPVAFAVTVPAEALTGRLDAITLSVAGALALASLAGSRAFFRRGLRQYSGASA
jgi:ABC-2 type transport system permease protein